MDKYSEFLDSYNFVSTERSEDELLAWLKKKIEKGDFESFKNYSDEELLALVKLIRPIIKLKLEVANELAREQLKNIKRKPSGNML
jgi:hypothetical protein